MPGIAPAMNIRPTETPVSAPTMIMGTLGGMIGPTVEAAAVIAAAKLIGYPSFFMPGIITAPIDAASATAVPEIPANNIDPATLVRPRPPRIQPTPALAKRMIRSVMPPPFIRLPAMMKPGIHNRTKESTPAKIFCGKTTSGMSAYKTR